MWYIVSMNNKIENLLNAHIARLQTAISGRDVDSSWDQELNKVDFQNIASLREGRIPQYRDHGPALPEMSMAELDDLTLAVA